MVRLNAEAQETRLAVPSQSSSASAEGHSEQQQSAALLRRCVSGDAAAWAEVVQLHSRRIYNICYRFTGSPEDAQDLAQEVFIKIYRTLKTYDGSRGAFTTWITTVTRNLLVDHYRARKNDRLTDSLEAAPAGNEDALTLGDRLPDAAPSPESHMQRKDTQKQVQAALARLSPDLREAVILRDLQELDYREIAAILRVPEGTVKSRINRGRTELARLLQRTYRQV
ncbi:MAG TPA: sigma-70 family RNA polymerase sigma factor [Terriglobales bacterium]|jgi:RNA polymerase sigma-70 factor (ECF subfamily)|nr:sigma-70 family RNA polymerase sigma factor [Terriglobales bacterium]